MILTSETEREDGGGEGRRGRGGHRERKREGATSRVLVLRRKAV
jgi:hypothetical protein